MTWIWHFAKKYTRCCNIHVISMGYDIKWGVCERVWVSRCAPAYQLSVRDQIAPAYQLSGLDHSQVIGDQTFYFSLSVSRRRSISLWASLGDALYRTGWTALATAVLCSLRNATEESHNILRWQFPQLPPARAGPEAQAVTEISMAVSRSCCRAMLSASCATIGPI